MNSTVYYELIILTNINELYILTRGFNYKKTILCVLKYLFMSNVSLGESKPEFLVFIFLIFVKAHTLDLNAAVK